MGAGEPCKSHGCSCGPLAGVEMRGCGPVRPGLLAARIPGGGAYAGIAGRNDIDGIVAADRQGRVAEVSLGTAPTLLTRVAALTQRRRLIAVDLPAGVQGYGDLRVLAEARKELADAGLERKHPRLIHAEDPAQVQLQERVDVAWAFSVLFHMHDEIVDACLGLVARTLTEDGVFYANVSLSEQREQQGRWQGFPVISRPRDFYGAIAARHGLAVSDVGRLDTLGHPKGLGDKSMMLRFARVDEVAVDVDGAQPSVS